MMSHDRPRKRRSMRQVEMKSIYIEPTTSDDEQTRDDLGPMGPNTRRAGLPTSRRRSHHSSSDGSDHSSGSDSAFSSESQQPEASTSRKRSSRIDKRRKTADNDDQRHVVSQPNGKRAEKLTNRATNNDKTKARTNTRSATGRRLPSPRFAVELRKRRLPTDGVIPPWSDLPSEIIHLILTYAWARDLSQEVPLSTGWLLNTALVCRAFAEPALTVLYKDPLRNLSSPDMSSAERLCSALQQDQSSTFLHYNAKIHDFAFIEASGASKHNSMLLPLVRMMPLLRRLSFYMNAYTRSKELLMDTFAILEINQVKLQALKILADGNKIFFSTLPSLSALSALDLTEVFFDGDIAQDICALPHLSHLKLQSMRLSSDVAGLPRSLISLQLGHCHMDTTAEDNFFLAYLLKPATRELKCLKLYRNRMTSLDFLCVLSQSCPQLELLELDAGPYCVGNSDRTPPLPLSSDAKVVWPATLRRLQLEHVRFEDLNAVNTFFDTLVNRTGTPHLSNLRELSIRAHIERSPWRERTIAREDWSRLMDKVYLRRPSPPQDPALRSLRAFRESKSGNGYGPVEIVDEGRFPVADTSPRVDDSKHRRSRRIAMHDEEHSRDDLRSSLTSSVADDDDSLDDVDANLYIQGMCKMVEVLFDNQRPSRQQYTEGDFLDSEPSGDEDWTQQNDLAARVDQRYAW